MHRRDFLISLGALGAAACARRLPAAGADMRAVGPVGLRLYTVRRQLQRDMAGTLAQVAAMGYREVEFHDYFGHTPAEVRRLLADTGLAAPSVHVGYDVLQTRWAETFDAARAVGHTWVTVPWLAPTVRRTLDDWKRVAESLNRGAERAHAAGLRFAYHNHDFELPPIDGVVPLELLLRETDAARVDFEMDVYWAVKAGGDPLALIERFPGRFRMLHLKDAGPAPERRMTEVGAGTIDWRAVLAARARAGTQHVFVEHDNATDPLASARASYEYLAAMK